MGPFAWRRCRISPVILAIVFISFLHNVLGRNRIRHYRDRFKRQQGAHLYLPGSFVTDNDEPEGGSWGEWTAPTPCSRSCGGGVASQTRQCNVGFECTGPEARHFSCNTQDCPDNADFREQQCSEYNSKPFEGIYYEWVPYTKAPNECELNCMPRGERFYFRHKTAVVDGTRCNEDTFDVCVQGECRPVGCDRMLGSWEREDQCRVCGGDGSSCNTFENEIPMKDMQVGYNDILLIPAGATNIKVEETGPSNNYLAVRNTSGYYYLNGNWRIDFPRSLEFAGCKFKYERYPQGFSAPDAITCLGPTEESLFIVLLYQEEGVPVKYTYSLPTNIPPPSNETYAWTYDEFTPCSATCGGGYQFRNVTCAGRNSLDPVDPSLCDSSNEPEGRRRCGEVACAARWVPYPWKECSAPCGDGGVQTRDVFCQQIVSNGQPTLVDDAECADAPKPSKEQRCNVGKICAKWHAGPWKPCDHLCGDGKQTRQVQCYIKEDGRIRVLEDAECEAIEPRPEDEKSCNVRPCEGLDWMASEWTGCERICGLESETRKVNCANEEGAFYPDELCDQERKPPTVRKCETTNATCEYLWYASQWSECSVLCGPGVQTRTLFCGVVTPEGTKKVENEKCDQSKHFETIKNCTGEMETCDGEWFSGPWSECSAQCGGGSRYRKVVCIKDNAVVDPSECGAAHIIFSDEDCNTEPCSEDTIMPTDVTHPVDESEPTKEREGTTEKSTDKSEVTDLTEGTTEPSARPTTRQPEEDEDDYEIVPDTNCDDGEWVDVEDTEPHDAPVGTTPLTTERSETESPLSLDDLMLSDGTTVVEEGETSFDTGSGEGELTSPSGQSETTTSDLEGSGTVSELFDTELTYLTDSSPFTSGSSTLEASGGTSGVEVSSASTTEVSAGSTTDVSIDTTSEVSTGTTTEDFGLTTTEIPGSTDVSGQTTESGGTSSEGSEPTTLPEASDLTTGGSDVTTEATTVSDISESTTSSEGSTTSSDGTDTTDSTNESTVTETTDSTITDTTESTITETTESTITETTESTITETTESTITETTESTITETTEGSTESSVSTDSTVTESTESTESTASGTEDTTVPSTTVSVSEGTSTSSDVTTIGTTTETEPKGAFLGESDDGKPIFEEPTTEPPDSTGSTEEPSSTVSGSTDVTTTELTGGTSSTESSGGTETTSPGSTEPSIGTTESSPESTGSTTELAGSTTEVTGSTESTTEFTGSTESTTEFIGSTESTTEFTGSTESTTEFTGSTESTTEFTGSTESTTEFTGSTETGTTESDIFSSEGTTLSGMTEETSESYGTTSIMEIFIKKQRMCKRRKIMACKNTKHGCCWDNITPAEGPFDAGCPTPKTCKESKYGCCPDEVSAALGPKGRGCPASHCNETLFGCCPDNRTVAEGNDYEGCPPACASALYGCCDDNVTEAAGPQHEGCQETEVETTTTSEISTESTEGWSETTEQVSGETESTFSTEITTTEAAGEDCNNSTYRCCPDGVTAATGPGFQGCDLPCSNSTFGCCQDGSTPAHGPSGEGCCLSSAFGCCPDNIISARGPNMEGCGCQFSLYGCCPDNETSSRGYNNEGCGCRYTRHGCCPDDFTPADGPDFLGCLCHTFQFGCCPDGVTTAQGPHQQGCGCRNSEFGCCSDEETPASGPNMKGCTCETTKYGCCLDGVSEAKGANWEGCDSAPVNLQAGCGVPKERGSCRNYTVKWFFDMDYGGCSRFWYGGCGGNANRYKTKEECEQICVEPQGKDICNLPKVAGPCEGYYPQWYYDKDRNNCAQLIYGGCLGNKNRFETFEECTSLCVTDNSIDACEQPKEEGPCQGQYPRFYYNKEASRCEPFIYGGCKGNNNNYRTIEACQQKCATPGRKKDHCSLPRAQGNCTERIPKWYYDTPEKRCLPFYYSGCNGNQNNFDTKEACETDCPMEIVKDTCQLAAETGECANYVDRWYYDTRAKACRQFYYGGCGGNGNNFETEQRCQERCVQKEAPETPPPEPSPPPYQPQPAETEPPLEPFSTGMCFLPSETGPCRGNFVKFFYDSSDGVCKSFSYGGCQGNRNNFESMEECLQHCGAAQDLCTLPPVVGACNGEYLQYYYDPNTDTCLPFNFGGCGGNYNRFQDQASCEQRCRRAPPAVPATQAPPVPSDIAMCYRQADPGNCNDSQVAFFFDPEKRTCQPFTYTGCGGNDNRFNSEEQCERQCGLFRGQDICNMDRDPGPCRGYFVKYYYDKNTGRCEQFAWGGCQGNGNRFSSSEECEHLCVTHDETKPNITNSAICQLPVDQGSCEDGYHKRWYFDDARGECIAFIYSGCGGNFNNFKSYQSCLDYCNELLPDTEPPAQAPPTDRPPHPCQEVFDECTTLRCAYGVEPYVDENECNRCRCRDPCIDVECAEDESCAIDINRNKTSNKDADFIAICRKRVKPGLCPTIEQNDNYCEEECRTDADCTLHLKCCSTGCGTSCVDPTPGQLITQPPEQPASVDLIYQAPKVDPTVFEPEVHALIGDQATLKCSVSGNPNPRIRWRKDNLEIDGTQPRYRIKLDQSLQIITLHKTDSGIYLCTADNGIGDPLTNEIKLDVLDSEPRQASILDPHDEPPVVVSLNAPTTLNCYALGYPYPAITWWKDDSLLPYKNTEFEIREDYSLLIHSVKLQNLGIYTCQAYNGYGKAASWAVTVKARGPYHFTNPDDVKYKQFIVEPPEEPTTTTYAPPPPPPPPPSRRPPPRPTPEPYLPQINYTEPSNEIQPEPPQTGYVTQSVIVPVRANITTNDQRYPVGSSIDLPCAVIGYPPPQVQWYKDGVPVYPTDRIEISESNTLSINQATKADSGYYQCEATNAYYKASSTIEILVEGMYIHPSCTDNQFFANCALIVKANICTHKYYAKFCCRSCTEAGLLPVDGPHLHSKQSALLDNLV